MKNCFTCKHGKEKYITTNNKTMLFYCKKMEKILIVNNRPIYICDEYEEQ